MVRYLHITVADRVAIPNPNARIVCDNNGYALEFSFDEEWRKHHQKIVRVTYNGEYNDYPMTGNVIAIPAVIDAEIVSVGVFADGLATTSAKIPCMRSARSEGGAEREPVEDVMSQVVAGVNKMYEDMEVALNELY